MDHPHQHEVAVFEAAVQLPAEQREAYLEQTCAGDLELLQRIRALLKADESETDFLAPAASAARPTLAASVPPTERPGDHIGRYKLLQQIGEGGCGVVYMAEQEEPIRRRVALKIIKLGMDTLQVVARFEAERQALALMEVCQAVQHAHQKGIIHRDLKPSNILVTVNDGVAVPQVIDFGIAKATTGERLTDKTVTWTGS